MKIGMNLVLWTLAVRPEHHRLLRSLRRFGYEGVEIPITSGNGEDFAEIRRVLDGEGLACTTLTNLRPDANPASSDAAAMADPSRLRVSATRACKPGPSVAVVRVARARMMSRM